MDVKGNLANNWEFFKKSWTYYEIETELDTRNKKIRVARLLAVTEMEVVQT